MQSRMRAVAAIAALLLVSACQQAPNKPTMVLSTKSPVQLRAMQSRAFDTDDRNGTLRTVIATLQDLGYTIDKVEPPTGTVSATKLTALRMTAAVTPRGTSQTVVRSNAVVMMPGRETQVDDPKFYQQLFFEPLSKAMFLTALQVEDGAPETTAAEQSADAKK